MHVPVLLSLKRLSIYSKFKVNCNIVVFYFFVSVATNLHHSIYIAQVNLGWLASVGLPGKLALNHWWQWWWWICLLMLWCRCIAQCCQSKHHCRHGTSAGAVVSSGSYMEPDGRQVGSSAWCFRLASTASFFFTYVHYTALESCTL